MNTPVKSSQLNLLKDMLQRVLPEERTGNQPHLNSPDHNIINEFYITR